MQIRFIVISCLWVGLAISIGGCGEKSTKDSGTSAQSQISSTQTQDSGKTAVKVSYDQLRLYPSGKVIIKNEYDFADSYANLPKYLEMFGRPHVGLTTQTLVMNGLEGTVTFVEFPTAADSSAAYKFALNAKASKRPMEYALFSNFLVTMQVRGHKVEELQIFAANVKASIEFRRTP